MGSALDADRCAARPVLRAGRDPHLLSGTGATDRREPGHLSADHHHAVGARRQDGARLRSEEHTSELQSLMRNSYAVFCLKKKKTQLNTMTRQKLSTPHKTQH